MMKNIQLILLTGVMFVVAATSQAFNYKSGFLYNDKCYAPSLRSEFFFIRSFTNQFDLDCDTLLAPIASNQSFCTVADVSDLVATGETGAVMKWYDVATGGTALTGTTLLTSGTYYVSQELENCESARTSVVVDLVEADFTGFSIGTYLHNSVTFNRATPPAPNYEIFYSTSMDNAPTASTVASVSNISTASVTITELTPNTTYYYWGRSSCNATDKGPWVFITENRTIASFPYEEDFQGEESWWNFENHTRNKWFHGTAAKGGTDKCIYISNDVNGETYTYSFTGANVSHAYKDFYLEEDVSNIALSFDWRCFGDGFGAVKSDYFRVWLVNSDYRLTSGTQITGGSGRILLDNQSFNNNNQFLRYRSVVDLSNLQLASIGGVENRIVRVVFEWRNDATDGNQPPAAIDNISIVQTDCMPPANFRRGALTQTSIRVSWDPVAGVTEYDVYYSDSEDLIIPDDQVEVLTVSDATTALLSDLTVDTGYKIWVRSRCSTTNKSIWVGPITTRTAQIPAVISYFDDFEGENSWTRINDVTNKWEVGTAVHSGSGEKSLYISNDEGVSHEYTVNGMQVSHAYRDFERPFGWVYNYLQISFDWMCLGEGFTSATKKDYFKVWLVPFNFVPTPGEQITALASNGIQIGKEFYNNNEDFVRENIIVNISDLGIESRNRRIVFEWINDVRNGVQPPAAIDNVNIKKLECLAPLSLEADDIRNTSVRLDWSAPEGGPYEYEILHTETEEYPGDDAEATLEGVTGLSKLIDGLTPNTEYYFWIRISCPNGKTFWVGPVYVKTLNDPAIIPYEEDFEGEFSWEVDILGTKSTNVWHHGTAASNGIGTHAMYISNDQGVSNLYTVNTRTAAHAFRDILFTRSSELELSFDWRAQGQNNADYLRVWLVPTSYIPTAGIAITEANSGGRIIGSAQYRGAGEFVTETILIDATRDLNQIKRLVFEWINDASGGTQPPAAVDNISIVETPCPDPFDVRAGRLQGADQVILSWEPGNIETAWDLVIQPQNGPPPVAGLRIEDTPRYLTPVLQVGELFEFYVRAVCDEENGLNSEWVGPILFSIFNPDACADLILEDDIEVDLNENAKYVLCEGDRTNYTLGAEFFTSKLTDRYKVEAINYAPPFPFLGGTAISLNIDDVWSEEIELPFDFCFFGEINTRCQVGSNGVISFKQHTPGSTNSYTVPEAQLPNSSVHNNAIMLYHDINPRYNAANVSINYQVLGTYPCRALVVNFFEVPYYSAGDECRSTFQMVLYEISNIIEIYVQNKPNPYDCIGSPINQGRAVLGIQNNGGTRAYTPPGRNVGVWEANQEAWRFSPDGDPNAIFEWLKDGELFSTDPQINIDVTETVTYTAKAKYLKCDNEPYEVIKEFQFLKEEDILIPLRQTYDLCYNFENSYSFDLKDYFENHLLAALNFENYKVSYHKSFGEAEAEINLLPLTYVTTGTEIIYARVNQRKTDCYKIVELKLNVKRDVVLTQIEDEQVCAEYTLPEIKENERYFTATNRGGRELFPGDVLDEPGIHKIFLFGQEEECVDEYSFTITVTEQVIADKLEDVTLQCEYFELPPLTGNNRYFNASGGRADTPEEMEFKRSLGEPLYYELFPGNMVYEGQKIYIYVESEEGPNHCIDETSFTVNYLDCPIQKGISPNGDGINDRLDLSKHGIISLKIFNRYGSELFSYAGLYKDEWYGQDKSGNLLPDGTYFYVAIGHSGKQITGWIQINK